MRTAVLLTFALTLSAVAPVPAIDPLPIPAPKPDAEAILGTWCIHTREELKARPGPFSLMYVFKPNGSYVWGYKGMIPGTYRIDPTASPKAIDFERNRGEGRPRVQSAIYKLSRDTLELCIPVEAGSDRPTEFKESRELRYFILHRLPD